MAKRYRGQFCWACQRIRPNERFSGRGHARHLCRDCARLPREELDYRKAMSDIGRIMGLHTLVARKHRKRLERFLEHPNERVRREIRAIFDEHGRQRARLRAEREEEERAFETWHAATEALAERDDANAQEEMSDDEIPF